MKKQAISEFPGHFDGTVKNPFIENKEVVGAYCRLSKGKKEDAKMKGYPGMLMKTKDRNCTVSE